MPPKPRDEKKGQIHPCKCTDYNGGQCYNCLNGAHKICEAKKRCGKRDSKSIGLRIVEKSQHKQKQPHRHCTYPMTACNSEKSHGVGCPLREKHGREDKRGHRT